MGESVQVRCPECLRTLRYAAPAFPCVCGTPVAPALVPDSLAEAVTHRNWSDEWVTVRCPTCSRASDWPHPEAGCPCGAVLRVPVRGVAGKGEYGAGVYGTGAAGPDSPGCGGYGTEPYQPEPYGPDTYQPDTHQPEPYQPEPYEPEPGADGAAPPRPGGGARRGDAAITRSAFRPVTIRTARDAVAASAGYLRWLGFRDVVQPEERSTTAVDLRGPGLVAQVDPSTRPTGLRAVECLWLNGLSNSAVGISFSLAGYTPDAHERAESLGIPLFVLDLTGTPQPVNTHAGELAADGAP